MFDMIKYAEKRCGGGACVQVENRPRLQSSCRNLSCFYVQGTNLSFVFRKHLVPWEFLNLCVHLCVQRVHLWDVHRMYMCMLHGYVCLCACVYVCLCPCTCVHAHVCVCAHTCAYISTPSHEEGGLLSCTRARGWFNQPWAFLSYMLSSGNGKAFPNLKCRVVHFQVLPWSGGSWNG